MSGLWALLSAAIERLNQQSVRIAELERAVTELEEAMNGARGT